MERWQLIALVLGIVILVLIGYGVINRGIAIDNKDDKNIEDDKDNTTKESITVESIWKLLIFIGIVAIIIAYFYFRSGKDDKGIYVTKAMAPDEFDEILKERLILRDGVSGYYDESGTLQFAPNTVRYIDQRPWTPTGTSHEFLAKDIEIIDNDNPLISGIHTVMVNLNRDKELVKGGLFTFNRNIDLFQWVKHKSYFKKLPPTSPESENLQMAQYASENDLDLTELQKIRRGMVRPSQDTEDYDNYDNMGYRGYSPLQQNIGEEESFEGDSNEGEQRPWYSRPFYSSSRRKKYYRNRRRRM